MIEIKKLTKTYKIKRNRNNVKALSNINLRLPDRGMIFLVGKSGSGKSTLMNIIGGIDKADTGEVIIDSYSSKNFKENDFNNYRNTYVGFIFQEYNLIEDLDVRTNISLALKLQGKVVNDEEISNILTDLDLQGYEKRMPNELSGGERQRVSIARALVKSPKVILADEPTGALDSKTSTLLLDKLKSLSNDKLIIIVSHDLEYANKYADRIIELADGEVVRDEKSDEFIETYHNKDLKLIKSRFPTKEALKLGFHNLFIRKTRLILMILITSVVFILFGLASSLLMNGEDQLVLNSMYRDDNYVTAIVKQKLRGNGSYYESTKRYYENTMTDKDMNDLKQAFNDYEFMPVYNIYNNSIEGFLNNSDNAKIYLKSQINGAMELNDEVLETYGLTILAGRLPIKNEQDNEIVITKYIYLHFLNYGYMKDERVDKIESYNDLLGKSILGFNIVGIIDTHFDEERYNAITDINNLKSQILNYQLDAELNYGIHALIYFRDNYFINHLQNKNIVDFDFDASCVTNRYLSMSFYSVATTDINLDKVVWKDGVKKDFLENGEIIVSSQIIERKAILALIEEFAEEHFHEIAEEFSKKHGPANSISYYFYLLSEKPNEYHIGYDYKYFSNEAMNNFMKNNYDFNFTSNIKNDTYYFNTVKVVGMYVDDNFDDTVVVSDNLFEEIIELASLNDVSYMLSKLKNNYEKDKLIFNYYRENKDKFVMKNQYKACYDFFEDTLMKFVKISIYVSIVLAIYSSILLYNFIIISIENRKKEIGILRSLGLSKRGVFTIFYFESLYISAVNFVISIIGCGILVFLFNKYLMQNGLIITLSQFGFLQIGLILLILIVVSFLATFLTISKMVAKKPNEIIKSI